MRSQKNSSSSKSSSKNEIGYRRPPKNTQFKKGKSGNPNGRPKGSRNVGAILSEVMKQKVSVTENGKTRRMPALEVMLRRLVNDAMRNDQAALKIVLPLIDRYAEPEEAEVSLDQLLDEDREILARYRRTEPSDPK
jgi:uncharacterized protein DUF5681